MLALALSFEPGAPLLALAFNLVLGFEYTLQLSLVKKSFKDCPQLLFWRVNWAYKLILSGYGTISDIW